MWIDVHIPKRFLLHSRECAKHLESSALCDAVASYKYKVGNFISFGFFLILRLNIAIEQCPRGHVFDMFQTICK